MNEHKNGSVMYTILWLLGSLSIIHQWRLALDLNWTYLSSGSIHSNQYNIFTNKKFQKIVGENISGSDLQIVLVMI